MHTQDSGQESYRWEFSVGQGSAPSPEILQGVLAVFRDGFAREGWSEAGIAETIARSEVVGLLRNGENGIDGYAFYVSPEARLLGRELLWEDAICLKKKVHGRGLSGAAIRGALGIVGEDVGWIGGRTQNPIVMKRYGRFGLAYPLDNTYGEADGPAIADYVATNIEEVREVTFDPEHGICKNAYRGMTLGDHAWNPDRELESRLIAQGFDHGRGDALCVVVKLAVDTSRDNRR